MDPDIFWSLFMDTGAPEMYLLYRQSLKETAPVPA